jgi:hypothetical protein
MDRVEGALIIFSIVLAFTALWYVLDRNFYHHMRPGDSVPPKELAT